MPVGAEGVGIDHMGTGLHIFSLNLRHRVRIGDIPNLRQLAHRQSRRLKHGAHAAVQDCNAIGAHRYDSPFDRCNF